MAHDHDNPTAENLPVNASSQHTPRRENTIRAFDNRTVANALRKAAALREQLQFCRRDLLLDEKNRPCDQRDATQASTQGCIRLAATELMPGNRHDARDLAWQAATAFQHHIGHGINAYDENPETSAAQVAKDLRGCAGNTEATIT